MWTDNLITSTDAINMLGVHHEHFKTLNELGVISAVAWGADRKPRFSKNQTCQLRDQRRRVQAVVADNFGRYRRRRPQRVVPAIGPMPYYPYDSAGQAAWAGRLHDLDPRLWRCGEAKREVNAAMRVYEKDARAAFQAGHFFDADSRVSSAAGLTRDQLYDLVWHRTMDDVADLVGMIETTLRQLCADCFIPTPSRGHFNFRDPVDRPPATPLPRFPKRRPS